MDFRLTYELIPEKFDAWRPRYCPELYEEVIRYANIGPNSRVLEIGPGTGQATEPFLRTGCEYHAIELSERFVEFMANKFAAYPNMHLHCGDFETYDFGEEKYDLVFSSATIQWIPEKIAFTRTFDLLKPGGVLAMFMTRTDERTPNAHFYDRIQKAYDDFFHPETPYTCRLDYDRVPAYGFEDFHYTDWKNRTVYTADDYCQYLAATQINHITLKEPWRTQYFDAVRSAVADNGDRMILDDTYALYLARRPK